MRIRKRGTRVLVGVVLAAVFAVSVSLAVFAFSREAMSWSVFMGVIALLSGISLVVIMNPPLDLDYDDGPPPPSRDDFPGRRRTPL
jgi:hypothetical protein